MDMETYVNTDMLILWQQCKNNFTARVHGACVSGALRMYAVNLCVLQGLMDTRSFTTIPICLSVGDLRDNHDQYEGLLTEGEAPFFYKMIFTEHELHEYSM